MSITAIALMHAGAMRLTSKHCMQRQQLLACGQSTTNALIEADSWLGTHPALHLPEAAFGGSSKKGFQLRLTRMWGRSLQQGVLQAHDDLLGTAPKEGGGWPLASLSIVTLPL